jgi:hypothetical protein
MVSQSVSRSSEGYAYGEALQVRQSSAILWQGCQWAMTSFGLEARDGCYPINARNLSEVAPTDRGLCRYMASKPCVDLPDCLTALSMARMFHAARVRESTAVFETFAIKHNLLGFNRPKSRPGTF